MSIQKLSFWLKDLISPILMIDGRLFIDRHELGLEGIRNKIAEYDSLDEAQKWINIFPVTDFVNALVFEDYQDAEGADILSIFETCWSYQINARYPGHRFSIERWSDDDAEDFGLWLQG